MMNEQDEWQAGDAPAETVTEPAAPLPLQEEAPVPTEAVPFEEPAAQTETALAPETADAAGDEPPVPTTAAPLLPGPAHSPLVVQQNWLDKELPNGEPLPLLGEPSAARDEVLPETVPDPQVAAARERREREIRAYWDKILTGRVDTIPEEVRQRAGADDETMDAKERDYRLLSTVNRSWVADHRGLSREEVQADWNRVRAELADELGVASDEQEVFTALSNRRRASRKRESAEEIFQRVYGEALAGREVPLPDSADGTEARVTQLAQQAGAQERERLLPLAQRAMAGLQHFSDIESADVAGSFHRFVSLPQLLAVVDELADLPEDERARVYGVLSAEVDKTDAAHEHVGFWSGLGRSLRRGVADLGMGLVQAGGNAAAAGLELAGDRMGVDSLLKGSAWTDKRLRVLKELQDMAQGQAFPITPDASVGAVSEFLMEAAHATPNALLSASGVGCAAVSISDIGTTVAAARARAPKGSITNQLLAGMLASGIQDSIGESLSTDGKKLFEKTMQDFARAKGSPKGYAAAALTAARQFAWAGFKELLSNSAGGAVDLATQEAAAHAQGVASDIDWQSYGKSMTEIDGYMRMAAAELPLVLIAGGRAALHHFKSPEAVLGDGSALKDWGIEQETIDRIMGEPDTVRRGELLREALSGSRRWSSPAFFPRAMLALKLLNTPEFRGFNDEETVRDFLQNPAFRDKRRYTKPNISKEQVEEAREGFTQHNEMADNERIADALRMMEQWGDRAKPREKRPQRRAFDESTTRYNTAEVRDYYNGMAHDTFNEMERNFFRLLLNTTTLQGLAAMKPMGHEADRMHEAVYSRLARAVVDTAAGVDASLSMEDLGNTLKKYYTAKNKNFFAPQWLQSESPRRLGRMDQVMKSKSTRRWEEYHPSLVEAYKILRTFHDGVYDLAEYLPHTEQFQAMLSRGMTVPQAYAHMLQREFHLKDDSWMLPALRQQPQGQRPLPPAMQKALGQFTRLTGIEPESAVGEGGKTYWRMQRPDGSYTVWHSEKEHALNDFAANVQLNFLPQYRFRSLAGAGSTLQLGRPWGETRESRTTGFAQLGQRAEQALHEFWFNDVTSAVPGYTVRRRGTAKSAFLSNRRYDAENPVTIEMTAGNQGQHFRVDRETLLTPYALANSRFNAYWQRLINSGEVKASEMARFLVRQGFLTDAQFADICDMKGAGQRASKKILVPGSRFQKGEDADFLSPAGTQAVVKQMVRYSMAHFVNHMAGLPLPPSVREWFALAPFENAFNQAPPDRTRISARADSINTQRWAGSAASRGVNELIDLAEKQRTAELNAAEPVQNDYFYHYVEEALAPTRLSRLEQGWCYAFGGQESIDNLFSEYQRLLEHPENGLKSLAPVTLQRLRLSKPTLGDNATIERKLKALAAVLQEHPELREYAADARDGSVWRMVLDGADINATPTYANPTTNKRGFHLERAELPPELAGDERVKASFDFLMELRNYIYDAPIATDTGIFRRGVAYGGTMGEPPSYGNFMNKWYPVRPLDGLRDIYEHINRHRPVRGVKVGGVKLMGLPPAEMDDWFRTTTTYRYRMDSAVYANLRAARASRKPLAIEAAQDALDAENERRTTLLRLMPGEQNVLTESMRRPYVVYSVSGTPLMPRNQWRDASDTPKIFNPLNGFRGELHRSRHGSFINSKGEEFLRSNWAELMERTKDEDALDSGRFSVLTNRELIMLLAEDTHFSQSLMGRDVQELTPAEARLVGLFHAMLRYEYGGDKAAAADIIRISNEMRENPELNETLVKTLDTARYGSADPAKHTWSGKNRAYRGSNFGKTDEAKLHPLYDDYKPR